MDNLFEQAANMARMQAAGYAAVREQARNEALEEAAKVCEEQGQEFHYPHSDSRSEACRRCVDAIRALKKP